jgi:membrane fusion protein
VAGSIQVPGEVEAPVALDAPAYSVVVALDSGAVRAYGREWPLRPGLLLEADVILERLPLYQRLLDPLRAIGRLGG